MRFTALSLCIVLCNLVSADTTNTYQYSGKSELFADDEIVASTVGVVKVFHAAKRMDAPVLEPTEPWEAQRLYIYGCVEYDAATKTFRMWYHASDAGILLATSNDGISWQRPKLGLHEYKGSKDNNIVLPGIINPMVYVDERETDPAKRYKALSGNPRNYRGFYSADGIHWTEYPNNPLINFGSEMSSITRDPVSGEFRVYIRPISPKPKIEKPEHKRTCSLTTSTDFLNWSVPVDVLTPDATDDAWVRDPQQRTEFYSMVAFPYGSQHLGFIPVFKIMGIIDKDKLTAGQSRYDGPLDVQLVTSRDGKTWKRMSDRKAIIANGPRGSYDAGVILNLANNPIIVGDEVWMYYTAINTTHGGPMPPKRATIGLAKWRLDGFASFHANAAPGVVETVPMRTNGGTLEVNADAAGGAIAVEVLSADGKPIDGYTAADCNVVTSDSVKHQITWKNHSQVESSAPIILRFHLTNADLYSFRFNKGT